MNPRDRYRACLLGLALGDALGATVEFKPPGTFEPLKGLGGGGPHQLKPGQWTDDTSMALCLADSLIESNGFDPVDQAKRYLRWWREGYNSSTGKCFDIGNVTAKALLEFERTKAPYCGSTDPQSAGNGCLMRLAPVVMFYAQQPANALLLAAQSTRITHGARECIDATRYFAALLAGALTGVAKSNLLSDHYSPIANGWQQQPLAARIAEVAAGSFKQRQPPRIEGSGYVVRSLEAALWAFYNSDDFQTGSLLAANLGDDADTTAAIFGQLAGAHYGTSSLPKAWLARLHQREHLEKVADRLHELCGLP